jgi:hypothetical protein
MKMKRTRIDHTIRGLAQGRTQDQAVTKKGDQVFHQGRTLHTRKSTMASQAIEMLEGLVRLESDIARKRVETILLKIKVS